MTDTEKIRQLELQLVDLDNDSNADIHEKIDLLNDLAWMLSDTDLKRAYALSETAHSLASSPDDGEPPYQIGLAYSLRTQGYLNQRFGDYPLGLTQLLKAQEISELLAFDDGLADVFDGIAGIYYQVGNFPETLNYTYKQLDAAQRIDDKRRMANAYNNLANVFFETGDFERAVETLNHNLQIAAETDYKRIEFLSYINLAETYLLAGDYEKALENALRGLPVSQEAGFELFEVYAFEIIGKSYLKLNDAVQAIHHFEKALALSRKVESKVTESLVLLNIGQTYKGMKQLDRALDYLQQSISVAQSIDAKSELFKGHLQLSEIYNQQENYAQALYHFKKHQSFKELVHGEKADERLQILRVAHDTENAKKEAEIFQLRTVQLEQEITERRKAEETLQKTYDELEQLVEFRTAELSNAVALQQQEIEERQRAEAEIQQMVELLEQRVADRSRELAALHDMTNLYTEADNITDLLEPALSNICNSIGGSAIVVHILDADQNQLQLAAHVSLSDWVRMQEVALTPVFADWLRQADAPVMLIVAADEHSFLPMELLPSHYQTYLGIALRVRNEVIGMLGVYREEALPFSFKKLSLLITMAEQLGIIIQNHRLQEHSHGMARTQERQRLARELHDSVAQRIYSLHLFARAGQDAVADGNLEDARLRLQQVEENALYTLRDMRLLLYQLRPLALEDQNLFAAIEERFDLVERQLGIEAVLQASVPPEVIEDFEEELYYIINEALNNALKHAGATRVQLRFDSKKDRLLITSWDNGQGFDPAQQSSGLGLKNMRVRAAKCKGQLDIESAIGQGTTIRITI